ncbi:integrase arm-type DNA-binding domain-containing protein [Mesorhizobium sp. NPDC059025]|uniref:integrase arm-type DNA-binding domain-containing protein n=1 Tax=unclassified Mesorhizobium TaxID=325217 RepID=UPI00367A37FA
MLITDKALAKLPFASAGQYRVNDTELKGFVVVIGRRTKTFAAQASFWRNGMREFATRKKIGEAGDMTSRDARSKAKEILAKIARGERPDDESSIKRGALSLRTAWERYREGHMVRKGRSAGTIENYRDHMDRLFADWLDKPLARLGRQPNLVVERHEKITREHGAYIANGAMRSLRAVYNHACKSHLDLPRANPVIAVDWNKEHRRETGMGAGPLAAWFAELSGLSNIVRREFHLLTLLSGSRPTALKHVRPEHVDFRRRVLHIPKPKGGEERAFDIPLSRPMIRCIIRALRIGRVAYPNQAESWLFPADSTSGHLVEHKEDRRDLSKWGNELRQTYRTLAQSAGVSQLDVHLLMNHSLPGVNAGYITRDGLLGDHLRKQQERISKIIIDAASGSDDGADTTWFRCSKLEFVISKPAFARAA